MAHVLAYILARIFATLVSALAILALTALVQFGVLERRTHYR